MLQKYVTVTGWWVLDSVAVSCNYTANMSGLFQRYTKMLLVVTCWSLLIAVSLIWRQGMTSKTMDVLTRFVFYIPFFRVFTRLTCQALDQMQVAKCFLLHSSRANDELKFIVNRCDSFASYWQQFIQKKYSHFIISHWKKSLHSPHYLTYHLTHCLTITIRHHCLHCGWVFTRLWR